MLSDKVGPAEELVAVVAAVLGWLQLDNVGPQEGLQGSHARALAEALVLRAATAVGAGVQTRKFK